VKPSGSPHVKNTSIAFRNSDVVLCHTQWMNSKALFVFTEGLRDGGAAGVQKHYYYYYYYYYS